MAILKIVKNICLIFFLLVIFVSCASTNGRKYMEGPAHRYDLEQGVREWADRMGF